MATMLIELFPSILFDVSLKILILASLAWLAISMLRVRSESWKHRVWSLVLLGIFLLPVLGKLVPSVPLPFSIHSNLRSVTSESFPEQANTEFGDAGDLASATKSTVTSFEKDHPSSRTQKGNWTAPSQPFTTRQTQSPVSINKHSSSEVAGRIASLKTSFLTARFLVGVAFWVYLFGAGLLLARLIVGLILTHRIVRRAQPIRKEDLRKGLPKPVKVAQSSEVRIPVVVGLLRPVLLLPLDWHSWSESTLRMVLAHEGEHVRRRDGWVSLAANVSRAIYWFHPIAWLVRRHLGELAERICDDEVIRATGERASYAENLLAMAGKLSLSGSRFQPLGVGMARQSKVEGRINAILDSDRPLAGRIGAWASLFLVTMIVPLVAFVAGLEFTRNSEAAEPASTVVKLEEKGDQGESRIVSGRVVMANSNEPVAGAEVRLLTWEKGAPRYDTQTTVSDKNGEFEFEKPGEGTLRLAAYYEGFASRTKRYKGKVVQPGEENVILSLKQAPALHVRVVSRSTQKPIEDATVRLTWTDGKRDHQTDANGEVTILGLTPEVWTIEVRAKGYAEEEQAINLTGSETANVVSELDPGVELYGVVNDEQGSGIDNVGISVFPRDFSGGQIEYLKTDSEGRFRFPYLPVAGLTLSLSKPGYTDLRSTLSITAKPGSEQEFNATLQNRPDGGSVRGVVTNAAGEAIVDAKIVNRGRSSRDVKKTTTNEKGVFQLDDVFEGSFGHDLTIRATGYAPQRLSFNPGSREVPAEFKVHLEKGHRIHGRVVDESGKEISGVRVTFSEGDSSEGMDYGDYTTTDDEGRFSFDSLPRDCPFAFKKVGYSEIDEMMLPLDGAEEVKVTLQSEGVIRGRVVDATNGKPISPFLVKVTFSPDRTKEDPSGRLSGARVTGEGEKFSTPDGEFRLGDFIRGMPLQVTVLADGYQREVKRRLVALPAENSEIAEFRLKPIDEMALIQIAGRIVNVQSQPIAGVELRLIVAEKRPFPRDRFPFNWEMIQSGQTENVDGVQQFLSTVSDKDGQFEFRGVMPAGDIELAYWGEGVSRARITVEDTMITDGRADLVVKVGPGRVMGRINKQVYPDVRYILLLGDEFENHQETLSKDDNESFEIRDVPPGSYELQVYGSYQRDDGIKDEFQTDVIKRVPITVRSGETLEVPIGFEENEQGTSLGNSKSSDDGEAARLKEPKTESGKSESDAKAEEDVANAASHSDQNATVITGTVTDPSGEPIGDAQVLLLVRMDEERLVKSISDSNGKYTLRVPKDWTKPGDFTPLWTAWCYHPGHQLGAEQAYRQIFQDSTEPIDFKLKPASDTGFIVTDPADKPISGALVEPLHFLVGSYDIIPEDIRAAMSAKTDANGRAMLPGIGREGFYTVRVTADGFGVQVLRLRDSADEPAIRMIKLRPTGRLEGRLVTENKEALQSAHVYVYQEDFLGEHTYGEASVSVDEQGRFTVPKFAEGPIELIINVEESLPIRPRIPRNLEIYAGEVTEVEIPLETTIRVRGRVQTKEGHLPGAEGLVSVQYGSFRQGDQVRTDVEGHFAVNALAGEVRQQLIMNPPEFSDWVVEKAGWQNPVQVPVGQESFDLPPLELIETNLVSGSLVDAQNRPIAGVRISAITENRVYAGAYTKEDGTFELHLPQGLKIEKYEIHPERGVPSNYATIISESPLRLRIE